MAVVVMGALVWSRDGGNRVLYAFGWLGVGLLVGIQNRWLPIEKHHLFI